MKTHYKLQSDTKTLCGRDAQRNRFVNGLENIEKVTCIVCINSLEANGTDSVERVSYYKIKPANATPNRK